jgi:D-arabinonate dehydratase
LGLSEGKYDGVACTKAVREAIGYDVDVMLDVNGAWTPGEALKAARQLERYNLTWLEEPIWPVDDYDNLSWLRTKTDIPIAGGENEFTHYGFKNILEKRPYDLML